MIEPKLHITFRTFTLNQTAPLSCDPNVPSYSLSMLRSVLLLKGLSQLMPSTMGFHEFARHTLEERHVNAPGCFSSLINQILEFYHFDGKILQLTPGSTRTNDHEYWFDAVTDPTDNQQVIFLKTSTITGTTEILQLARLEAENGKIHFIYDLLKRLRMPEINLQEIVNTIASNQSPIANLVASLTEYTRRIHFTSQEAMGVLEVFLLLGQEHFKEWVLTELVKCSKELEPPRAELFHYPQFVSSSLPDVESLSGAGFIEALYILGFLCLADDIRSEQQP